MHEHRMQRAAVLAADLARTRVVARPRSYLPGKYAA
jgi:hypothetical protein